MKRIKRILLLLAATALTTAVNAQTINGDLNHSGKLEVSDVTRLINNYLTGTAETISGGGDPFSADNSRIVGTWYRSPTESITFNADGTTDYGNGCTYEFLPYQGCILFSNAAGIPVSRLRIVKLGDNYLAVSPNADNDVEVYSKAYVSLSRTEVGMKTGESIQLAVTATPPNVGNVTWTSSNESVATVSEGLVKAVGEGAAYIVAETAGGRAVCTVTVADKVFISKITLSKTSVTLYIGDGYDGKDSLVATIEPSDASNKTLRWRTSNPNVVIPTITGTIIGKSAGKATITCSAADGSGVEATCTVTVIPLTGTENGHDWVDLGLPSGTLWATMNVGASAPEEYGDHFAWGETTPKSIYDWSTYIYCNGSNTTMTKYCTDSESGTVDNKTTLELADDAAHANWGGSWRMPTNAELTELRTQCTWKWMTQNGVSGRKVTGPNGNSIFLPAAGYYSSSLNYAGSDGNYWSSSLDGVDGNSYACRVYFNSGSVGWNYYAVRCHGRCVRPVCQ